MYSRPTPASLSGQVLLSGDLAVNRVGYGMLQLVGARAWGPPLDRVGAIQLVRRAAELGVNYVNSANAYGPHLANELLADALYPYGDLVIGNKIGPTRGEDGSWGLDTKPESLNRQLQEALRRLKVDTAELAILRADGDLPDDQKSEAPWEDSVGAMAELRQRGLIKRVGVSGVTLPQLLRARAIVRIDVVENRYNVLDRRADAVLADCEAHGTAFTPYHPLGAGNLPGEIAALHGPAERLRATPAQIALAWLLRRSPVIVCIPGTKSLAHLEDNVAAGSLASALTRDEVAALTGSTSGKTLA